MKRRIRLLRIGAVALSLALAAGYVGYRTLAGHRDGADLGAEGQPEPRLIMPSSKPAEIRTSEDVSPPATEPSPQRFMPGSKSGFIVTPEDVAPNPPPPEPATAPAPERLGPR